METIKARNNKKVFRKKTVIICMLILLLMFLTTVIISIYVGIKLTAPKREGVDGTPKKYNLVYDDISFKSKYDDILLKGWWIPAQDNKIVKDTNNTVIFAHGYGNSRTLTKISIIELAKTLAKEGYNVLTFDFRASGESEGKFVSIGGLEKYDLLSAIDFAKNNKQSKNISLVGWSMGASTSILAGVESKDVKNIVADSPFGNLNQYLKENLSYWSNLPNTYFTSMILNILPKLRGIDIESVNPIKAASHLKNKHLLLIHSKDDEAIPYTNSKEIYNAISDKENVSMWITEKAKHIKSYSLYKEEYEKRLVDFLNKCN